MVWVLPKGAAGFAARIDKVALPQAHYTGLSAERETGSQVYCAAAVPQ
jgi:hypothetical protein